MKQNISPKQVAGFLRQLAPLIQNLIAVHVPIAEESYGGKITFIITNQKNEQNETFAHLEVHLRVSHQHTPIILYSNTLAKGIEDGKARFFANQEEIMEQFGSVLTIAKTVATGIFGDEIISKLNVDEMLSFATQLEKFMDLLCEKGKVSNVAIKVNVVEFENENLVLVQVFTPNYEKNSWEMLCIEGEMAKYWLPTLIERMLDLLEQQPERQNITI